MPRELRPPTLRERLSEAALWIVGLAVSVPVLAYVFGTPIMGLLKLLRFID